MKFPEWFQKKYKKATAVASKLEETNPSVEEIRSWFGVVTHALPHEEAILNHANDEDIEYIPLIQIDFTQIPLKLPEMEGIEVVTVFLEQGHPGDCMYNGCGWFLRAYEKKSDLIPVRNVRNLGGFGFPLKWSLDVDYPVRIDEVDQERLYKELGVADDDYLELPNIDQTKIGGYPSERQDLNGFHYWTPDVEDLAVHGTVYYPTVKIPNRIDPRYIFQVGDMTGLRAKSRPPRHWDLNFGDNGMIRYARGTGEYESIWAREFDCY